MNTGRKPADSAYQEIFRAKPLIARMPPAIARFGLPFPRHIARMEWTRG